MLMTIIKILILWFGFILKRVWFSIASIRRTFILFANSIVTHTIICYHLWGESRFKSLFPIVATIKLSIKIKNKKQNVDFNLSMLMSLSTVHQLSRKLLSNNYRLRENYHLRDQWKYNFTKKFKWCTYSKKLRYYQAILIKNGKW